MDVDLHQRFSGESLEQVRDGALDAGFYFGDAPPPPLEGRRLRPMSYRVVVPLEWGEKLKDATWADIAAMPWVFTPLKSSHRQLMMRMFAEHGLEAHKAAEADQEAVIADLVASGVGLSLTREEVALAGQKSGRWLLWDKASMQSSLWFIYRADRAKDPIIVAMLEAIDDIWPAASDATVSAAKPATGKSPVPSR